MTTLLLALFLLAAPVDGEVLLQMLAVDTSHGNETKALEPVAERFKAAGVPVQILESSPGRGNLIARVKGTGARRPLLLLAHIDVVPVEGQPWETKPFQPTEKDGFLYARGVSDDKAMAAAIVAVALELAGAPQKPSRDVIVALTAGEETGGFAGVQWLLKEHRDLLDAELALNEGGALQLDASGARVEQVGLQVSEKTFQTFKLVARGKGGHSSVPPTEVDPVVALARALVKVGALRFPAHVLPEVKQQLARAAAQEKPPLSDALRSASASAPRVSPKDDAVLSRDRIYNALIRTTCVTTMLQAAPQDNVLPTTAEAQVNCRILPDETIDSTQAALAKAAGDASIELTRVADFGSGGPSPAGGEVERAVRAAAARVFGDAVVIPILQMGATDSRHLRRVGIASYGLHTAPGTLDDQRKGFAAHGANERRLVRWLPEGTQFLREVVAELVK
jgi:acetylornithine deacetylase/succinyl-diaminopimelate desuccinylase-like protein